MDLNDVIQVIVFRLFKGSKFRINFNLVGFRLHVPIEGKFKGHGGNAVKEPRTNSINSELQL